MELIVTGATGFVGSEVLRQALRDPAVTSVVALARKPVENTTAPENGSKFTSVVVEDWTAPYPDRVKAKLQDADGCVWALAVTPSASKTMDFEEVTKVCHDFTTLGLATIAEVARKPFRFVYLSGVAVERDQSAALTFLADYRLMRGRTETAIIDFANQHSPDVQATVAKPAHITGPGIADTLTAAAASLFQQFGPVTTVHVSELAAAMIDQCINGITEDPLWSAELQEVGKRCLSEKDYLR